MNKKDKRKLCKFYDEIIDRINNVSNVMIYPRLGESGKLSETRFQIIKCLNSELKELAENIIDDFDLKDIYVSEFLDDHLGCYSYPNCDLAPLGCCVLHGIDEAECYGHKD